jgi:glycine cleavage system regulatory protein
MTKFTKKHPVVIEMPFYMEEKDGTPYLGFIWGAVVPSDDKPQVTIDVISVYSGHKITFEELISRRSVMYPNESPKSLEKEIYDMMIDCGEYDQ